MDTITDHRAVLHRAYWPTRAYWRELADQHAPHLTRRDLIHAARILHAVAWADQRLTEDGSERHRQTDEDNGRSALEMQYREVLAPRQSSDPRDVACRAAAIALTNVSGYRSGDRGRDPRWTAPAAPDPFEGARHQTVAKRSNSGRTNVRVTRSGVAPVIGRADRTAAAVIKVTRQVGRGLPVPSVWSGLVPAWRRQIRYLEGPTYAPAVPDMPAFHAAVGLHLLEHGPRRSGHHNALHVMAMTARLYPVGHVSDLTEHPEITPALPGFDPRGVAVHRSDMSGQTGILALTASQTAADLARHPDRLRLPAVRARKAETDRTLVTSADDDPRPVRVRPDRTVERDDAGRITYVSRANCQPDHRGHHIPPVWFVAGPDGIEPNSQPAVWFGHHLVKRDPLADRTAASRGNRGARTIGEITTAVTISTVETIAADLEPGERIVIIAPDGSRARINRASDGRFSATCIAADGTRINPRPYRTRTVEAIARKISAAIG